MELKHLRAFVALAEELHFGRAAERLHIVQPALSMQIKALEQELNVLLFERDRHRVSLSHAGSIFLPEARATLEQAHRAVQRARSAHNGEIGSLRLGEVSSVVPHLLPRLIRRMHARYPDIELVTKDMPSPDQIAALRDGRIDFGFVRLPLDARGIQTRELIREPFLVALPSDHPLSARASVSLRDLSEYDVFVLARRFAPGLYDGLLTAFQRQGLTLRIGKELGEFTTMIALVAAGMGIGILPSLTAVATMPGLALRPLDLPDFHSSVGLAWTSLDDPIKRIFMDVIDDILAEPPP
ncbi:LysR family transcriptional regulator [Uliginosibacterium sp. sgz301328]|uniref:LysR family transcriptional regulator n=1 Tax=Uliginosibacterium sp. sgz301328 TaxID=3243764 RepID=UPI00359EE5BA